MSTEDINNSKVSTDTTQETEIKKSRENRVPVASANGNETAKLNDNVNVGNRRKRVRINTNNSTISRAEQKNKSVNNIVATNTINSYSKPISETDRNTRSRYEEEYHRNRTNGNYNQRSYNNTSIDTSKKRKNYSTGNNNFKNRKYNKNNSQSVVPKPIKFEEKLPEEIRINKYIANSGICSRREADIMIEKGEVLVNGVVVTELGTRVKPSIDRVECNGKLISVESKVYILLNKPKNCVTTLDDPQGRQTVMDIVKNACSERIYPVGRLDRNTVGVLLLTNDGELATKLTHPSFMKKKIYHVWLNKPVSSDDMQKIVDGIKLEDGEIHADALSYVKEEDKKQVGIEIHSGKNRIVRRIFEHLGYRVVKLDRVYFSGLTKKNLPRGKWRFLDRQEVINLKNGLFE